VVDHSIVEGKNAIVLGAERVLAIDTGNLPAEGEAMADLIRVQRRSADWLLLTHGHGDHILGSGAFRGGVVFAHQRTADVMRRHLPGPASRYGHDLDALAASLAWPNVTFADDLTLDLGGKTVRVIPTPGHSEDGVCAYVVEDRLLVGGDAVVTGIVPAVQDGDSRVLEASLRRLLELQIDVLVPGHGPVVRGPAVRDWLVWLASYLAETRACVRAALARGEDPLAVATFERLVGDRLPGDRHGMPRRHASTVAVIAGEERI
jgi:cyclase